MITAVTVPPQLPVVPATLGNETDKIRLMIEENNVLLRYFSKSIYLIHQQIVQYTYMIMQQAPNPLAQFPSWVPPISEHSCEV